MIKITFFLCDFLQKFRSVQNQKSLTEEIRNVLIRKLKRLKNLVMLFDKMLCSPNGNGKQRKVC